MRRKTELLLLLLPLAVLWRPLSFGETFYYQDLAGQYFPTEHLLARAGMAGWNPHIFLGLPMAGDPQTAAYEPVRALCRAAGLAPMHGFLIFVAFYLLVAAFGAYAFALRRRATPLGALLCALVYVAAILILRIRHPWIFVGLALIPWVAIACDRLLEQRRLADAIAIALLITWGALGGHPQWPYITGLFVVAYVALGLPRENRARTAGALAWRLGLAALLGAAVLAFYYAPVVAFATGSARHGTSIAFAGSYSWNPWDWARLLAPDIYGNDMAGTHFGTRNYHEQTIYLGIAPLLLAVLAIGWRADRHLARLGAGAFVLAAGKFLPLFYLAYYLVPGFKLFRAPVRYGVFFALAMAVLAALALSRIQRDERPERPPRWLRWFWIVFAIVFAGAAIAVGPWIDRYAEPGAHVTMRWAAARAAILLVAAGLVLDRFLHGRLAGRKAAPLLVALTVADLALQWGPYRQTRPPAEAFPPAAIARALAEVGPAHVLVHAYTRDARREAEVTPLLNWGEAAGYDNLRGYNQGLGPDILALLRKADEITGPVGTPREEQYALGPCEAAEWLLDLAGVRRIVSHPDDWPERWRHLPTVAAAGEWEVRDRPASLPRAWLVGAAEIQPGDAALERLPTLDPRQVATVDADVGLPRSAEPAGEARMVRLGADDVVVDADATRPALLVLADHFDTGWSATVDGAPRPIVRADFVLRGVRIEAGHHRVAFHYDVPGRRLGRVVSEIAIPLVLFLLLFGYRQRKTV